VVQKDPKTGKLVSTYVEDVNYLNPYFVRGFPGAIWITLNQYQGIQKIGDVTCYKFVRPPARAPNVLVNGDFPLPEFTALINVANKVPVRINLGIAVYQYSPMQPINPDLDVPPDVAKFLAEVGKEQNSLEIMRQYQSH
jgi:hypothetical protein